MTDLMQQAWQGVSQALTAAFKAGWEAHRTQERCACVHYYGVRSPNGSCPRHRDDDWAAAYPLGQED